MMGWNERAERAETKAMFWEQEYHAQKAEIERLRASNAELLAALVQCAADFRSEPGTVMSTAGSLAREFMQRQEIASAAIAKAGEHT